MDVIYLGLVIVLGSLLVALVNGCARLMQRAYHKSAIMGGVQAANTRGANSAKATL